MTDKKEFEENKKDITGADEEMSRLDTFRENAASADIDVKEKESILKDFQENKSDMGADPAENALDSATDNTGDESGTTTDSDDDADDDSTDY